MAENGDVIIPKKEWWHFRDWLSRQDELMQVVAELLKENVKLLKVIAVADDGEPPISLNIRPITTRLDKIITNLDRDYPRLINEVDIDTSKLTWKELKISGTGFSIMNMGGGFTIKVPDNSAKELTVVVGDKFDMEFDGIYVKGAGAGTGVIRYWRRK